MDRDLHELLESAGIDGPIVLVGGSFGGMIVAYYAALHPEDVVGVVMLDVPAPSATLTVEEVPQIAWDHPENPEHTDTVAEFENRFAAERPSIEAPLVVITAKDGGGSVEDQAIWLEISPNATQIELEGGHGLAYDNPDGVAAEILKLIDEIS